MVIDELLEILPKKYYVGQVISNEKFESLSRNTEFLNKRIRGYVREITVLYVIRNSNNSNELQIINVEVNYRDIRRSELKELVEAIQRGILYKTIIIFTSDNDWYNEYKIVVPICHPGKKKEIMVIDSFEESCWCAPCVITTLFKEAMASFDNKKIDISLFRDKIVKGVRRYPAENFVFISGENDDFLNAFNTLVKTVDEEEIRDILYGFEEEDVLLYDDEDDESFSDESGINANYNCLYSSPKGYYKSEQIICALERCESSSQSPYLDIEKAKEYFKENNDEDIVNSYECYLEYFYQDFIEGKEDEICDDIYMCQLEEI